MNKTPVLAILAVILASIVAAAAIALPFGEKSLNGMFRNNEAAKAAINAGDYNAFVAAVNEDGNEQGRWAKTTEEQFNKMVEQQKEIETKRAAMHEQMDAVNAALDAGDYSAWQSAISGLEQAPRFAEKITEENFGTYVKLHQAQKEVQKLAEELGIGPGLGQGSKQGMGRMEPGMRGMGPGEKAGQGRMNSEKGASGHEMPAQ